MAMVVATTNTTNGPATRQNELALRWLRRADSVIRMERWEEERKRFDERDARLQRELRTLHNDVSALVRESRAHEKRIRTSEKSVRRRDDRFKGLTDIVRILTRLGAVQSKRIDQIERRNSD